MELEFYFPKTKSKHKCVPTTGKVYPSKGGTIRYGVQATMNGSKSLPKYITEQEFNRLGFGAETFEASVDLGEKRISSRKDYDIDNDYEYEDLEIGDVDLMDYEDDLNSNLEDDIRDAIRESVDDNLPLDDGDTGGGYVDVDTEIDISVPVSGQVKFDWTSNENYHDENTDNEWNAEYLREKEQVAGLDKEERYELYDSDKLDCDECGAVNETVGYVEEGYKLCEPCDREWMAKQGYEAEMASLSEIVFEDNVGKKYTTHSDYDHSLINDMVSDEDLVPMDAETIGCPICKGEVHGDMSMIGEEIDYDICGDCDIYIMPQGISCIECGFGDPYGSATPCESCEPIADKMKMVNKNAETVGNPSPSSPLEEVPATVPSPAEPTNENFGAESGQMCEVCFGKDDLPYNSDNFTECKRCGKSVCMDCDGEMQYHPDWFKVCGECSDVLDNVHDYGAESKNTKMVLGITALGIGLAFWKGKDLLSLWDRIKEKMD